MVGVNRIVIASLSFVVKVALLAGTQSSYAASVKNCEVTFQTIGKPILVQIKGKSDHPCTGTYELAGSKLKSANFKMKLDKLETGIELRNKHLRDNYLHVDKHPYATLTVKSLENLADSLKKRSGDTSSFLPELTLHGVTKPIKGGTYKIEGKKVFAEFRLELLDFGIERPMFMGIKVVDAVIVRANFEL